MKGGEKMKTEYLYAVIGLLAGILIAIVFTTNVVNTGNTQMMQMMGMRNPSYTIEKDKNDRMGMGSSMEEMMGSLEGKSGDEFDKAFIYAMTLHHKGAIDMAELARQNAMHDEIKQMAEEIISAQTEEIEMMQDWQKQWGY